MAVKYRDCKVCGDYADEDSSELKGYPKYLCKNCYLKLNRIKQHIDKITERRKARKQKEQEKELREKEKPIEIEKINVNTFAEELKVKVKEMGLKSVDDLLALSKANDPLYPKKC